VRKAWARRAALPAILLAAPGSAPVHAQSIVTVAGGGTDDGRDALEARLREPTGVAVQAGTLYVVDTENNRIRSVDPRTSLLRTVAGTGVKGFSGDGGPAVSADLDLTDQLGQATLVVHGMAFDSSGSFYFADRYNRRVRRVSRAGLIDTVAGGGQLPPGLSDGGPATAAFLDLTGGVAIDAARGLLYVAGISSVRRVNLATGIITTYAGGINGGSFAGDGGPATAAKLSSPQGLTLDRDGNLHIADFYNDRVRRVDVGTGIITTVAGGGTGGDGGPATAALVARPYSVAFDGDGNLYVQDGSLSRVRRVDRATGILSTFAGGGVNSTGEGIPATSASLVSPRAIALDEEGNLYVTEAGRGRVRRVSASDRTIRTAVGAAFDPALEEGIAPTSARLSRPTGVALDRQGRLLVSDTENDVIRIADLTARTISTFAGKPGGLSGDGGLATQSQVFRPEDLAIDSSGNVFLSEPSAKRVRRVAAATGRIGAYAGTGTSGFTGDGGPATAARVSSPRGLALDSSGTLYIADQVNNRIRRVRTTGVIDTVAGSGAFTRDGDGVPATQAGLVYPFGVAIQNDRWLAIGDFWFVSRVDLSSGLLTRSIPESAYRLATDAAGNLFVGGDSNDGRVRRVDAATGAVTTVAGGGTTTGDLGPATESVLGEPTGLAVSPAGDLYVVDRVNDRVKVVPACRASLGPFDATFPPDGASGNVGSLNLGWTRADAAFRYDVVVDTEFPPRKVARGDVTSPGAPIGGLIPGKTYFWQVRAKGDPNCPAVERMSGIRRFTVPVPCAAPAAPVLVPPASPGPSTALAATPVQGASSYDVLLGAGPAPTLAASGLAAPAYTATGLAPGPYRWRVVARAACDATFATSSAEGSFTVPGSCVVAPPPLVSPADGATAVEEEAVLRWQAVPGAVSYDVALGTEADPPLHAGGVTGSSLAVRLSRGTTYRWRVSARPACEGGSPSASGVRAFTVAACAAPAVPADLVSTKGTASLGSRYTLAWGGVRGAGAYRVERSRTADFASVETWTVAEPALVLVAAERTSYAHRVVAIASCGASSAPSAPVSIVVSAGVPHVTMTTPPRAAVIRQSAAGSPLPRLEIELRNTGTADFAGFFATSQAVPFFTMSETTISLRAGQARLYFAQLTGVPADRPGRYEGLVTVTSADPGDATAHPQAPVSLVITSVKSTDPIPATSAPLVLVDGSRADEVRLAPAAPGEEPPERTIEVRNPGSVALELGADVLPSPFVSIAPPDWNASPIAPGATRELRLQPQRLRGEGAGAYPRVTYLTFCTVDGKSARILVEDPGPAASGPLQGRPPLAPSETSLVVPSLVNAGSQTGGRYVSRLLLTNLGPEPAQVDLYYTPDLSPQEVSGLDAAYVKQATLVVPGHDVVSFTDAAGRLFGVANGSGSLEVRSARIGSLRVQSVVDAPAAAGGSFGFQLPTVRSGEGVRPGIPHAVPGVRKDAVYRTNLILVETSGERASVTVSLLDRQGATLGRTRRDLAPWAKTQLPVAELAGDAAVSGGALEIVAEPGSAGSVAAVTTVIDGRSGDASSFVGRAVGASTDTTITLPSVVTSATFRSRVEIRNDAGAEVRYRVAYRGSGGTVTSPERTLAPRTVDAWDDVLGELFGLAPLSFGPLEVRASAPGLRVVSRVSSETPAGSFGDVIEGVGREDPATAAGGRLVLVDGLEGTADGDRSRGARTNLILTEIAGASSTLEVTVWEKSQRRSAPVGRLAVSLGPHEQLQINDLFGVEGFGIGRKDRTGVLCEVRSTGGEGRVAALATRIDNGTNDTKNLVLRP